jgi:lipid kinase YegS
MRFAAEAALAGMDAVVAAGGDGTLNEVVNGVVHPDGPAGCAVGVLPLGTANDFAVACGIPMDNLLAALLLVAEGDALPIDIGALGDHVFMNVASGGFGTQVTADTPPEIKQVLGAAAYVLTGLRQVTNLEAQHARIVAPGFTWEGAFYALAVGNGRQAGGGFQVCPRALLDDGLLDVLIIPDMPLPQLLILLGNLRQGTHVGDERVTYHQVPWLEVQTREPLQVNLDGEPYHDDTLRFRALEQHLRVYLPPTAPLRQRKVLAREGT